MHMYINPVPQLADKLAPAKDIRVMCCRGQAHHIQACSAPIFFLWDWNCHAACTCLQAERDPRHSKFAHEQPTAGGKFSMVSESPAFDMICHESPLQISEMHCKQDRDRCDQRHGPFLLPDAPCNSLPFIDSSREMCILDMSGTAGYA